jgi:hypothetical protein
MTDIPEPLEPEDDEATPPEPNPEPEPEASHAGAEGAPDGA